MRIIAFSILLLFGAVCQRTEVSKDQTQNINQSNPISNSVSKETSSVGNDKKEGINNPFGNTTANSPTNSPATNKTVSNSATTNGFEKRCGWLANPTPANFWINDADGEWTISVQGGYQAEGTDYLPDFGDEWVKTNGNYGYGCMCMEAKVDKKEMKVTEIKKASVRPLSACRNDKNLKEPKAD